VIRSAELLWIVYVVAFGQSLLAQFFGPAENALLPNLVGEEHLMAANSMNALNNNLARLIGPALGGVLAITLGLTGVALIDAATFLLAALLIALIRQPDGAKAVAVAETAPRLFSAIWNEWLAGLQLVRSERVLTVLFTIAAITALGEGVLSVLFIPFVTDVLRGEALELGWLMSAQAVGGLLGGMLLARVGSLLKPLRTIGPSALMFGLIDLAIFNYPAFFAGFTIALVLFVVVGLPGAAFSASFSTLLQRRVVDSYRGRVFGALNTTIALIMLGGMGLASIAGDVVGIVPVINIQGFGYIVAGLLALRLRAAPSTADRKLKAEN
jgi:MFS family permease